VMRSACCHSAGQTAVERSGTPGLIGHRSDTAWKGVPVRMRPLSRSQTEAHAWEGAPIMGSFSWCDLGRIRVAVCTRRGQGSCGDCGRRLTGGAKLAAGERSGALMCGAYVAVR
jgi:hypothetical protein